MKAKHPKPMKRPAASKSAPSAPKGGGRAESRAIPRTCRMSPVSEGIAGFLERLGGANAPVLYQLWQNWEMVMGPQLAEMAIPLGHRHSILIIGGEDNLVLQELAFQTGEILERANAFMNEPYFTRVELRLILGKTPLSAPPAIQPSTRRTEPPEKPEGLRGTLKNVNASTPEGRAYLACLKLHKLPG
ncbi:MAG: DUF721 domain-containing protein [Desulfovibrionaceae bacterium]|nr:DUF721 domain-containing protein [Desulfovibrionaceae bacterium]